jgi:hypothetical protein
MLPSTTSNALMRSDTQMMRRPSRVVKLSRTLPS